MSCVHSLSGAESMRARGNQHRCPSEPYMAIASLTICAGTSGSARSRWMKTEGAGRLLREEIRCLRSMIHQQNVIPTGPEATPRRRARCPSPRLLL